MNKREFLNLISENISKEDFIFTEDEIKYSRKDGKRYKDLVKVSRLNKKIQNRFSKWGDNYYGNNNTRKTKKNGGITKGYEYSDFKFMPSFLTNDAVKFINLNLKKGYSDFPLFKRNGYLFLLKGDFKSYSSDVTVIFRKHNKQDDVNYKPLTDMTNFFSEAFIKKYEDEGFYVKISRK